MSNRIELWDKASALNAERAGIHRKMQWQAACLADEGKSVEQITAAISAKHARYEELSDKITVTMRAWANA